MRDAVHVQKYRFRSAELDALTLVQESATRTIDARKTAGGTPRVHETTARGHGRGRGRGKAVPARFNVGGHGSGQGLGIGGSERLLSTLRE